MRVPIEDMTIVIRAAGERTLSACEELTRRLVAKDGGNPERQMVVISERPFAVAVRRTFEIGLEARRPWVVGLDADVLLLEDGLARIGAMCACAEGATFSITPRVLCRFFGGFCCKGVHMYPAAMLERGLREMETCGSAGDLRPEGAVARAMMGRGLSCFGPPVVVGVHDFEQSYVHIYLKARLRARREAADGGGKAGSDSMPFVMGRSKHDADFLLAMWGMLDGHADAGRADAPTHYDWNAAYPGLLERMRAHGLAEKRMLEGSARGFAERVIGAHDFGADVCTPVWMRKRFGFEGDRGRVLARMGVAEAGMGGALTFGTADGLLRRAS